MSRLDRLIALPTLTLALLASPAALAQPSPVPTDLIDRIRQADNNGDGQITRAELLAWRARQFARLDRNGDRVVDKGDVPAMLASRFEPRMQQLVAQFDTNHDGRVSQDEFVNGPTSGFDAIDGNHDGVVNQAELASAMAVARAAHAR